MDYGRKQREDVTSVTLTCAVSHSTDRDTQITSGAHAQYSERREGKEIGIHSSQGLRDERAFVACLLESLLPVSATLMR